MKIVFIGTSSGRTSLRRFHSSFLIKSKKYNLLIDAGDGISKALLKCKIDYNSIDAILFSHYHADHFTGIGALITQMKLIGRTKILTIYTHKNLIQPLNNLINSVYMFKENLGFELDIIGFDFDEKIRMNNNLNFTARQNSHIQQKEFLSNYPSEMFVSSSFLFEIENKKIFYSSDIGTSNDLYLFENAKPDFMITETMHIATDDIYEAFKKIKPKKIFLTHIDEPKEKELNKWYCNLPSKDKRKIIICSDGLEFKL